MRETIPWGTDLAAVADAFGPLPAVHDGTHEIDFVTLAGRAARLALTLCARGVQPGEVVASSLRNSIEAVWVSMALRLCGACETPLNASYTDAERRHCLALAGARLVVTMTAQAAAFEALDCAVVAVDAVEAAAGDPAALSPVPAEAWGRINFTSGTTGKPKAIVITHQARWIANILQRASLAFVPGPGSTVLLMTPFVHGAGIITQAFHDRGAKVVLLDGVDIPTVWRVLADGIDHIFAPPTVLAKLVGAFEGQRIGGIRCVFCGTAPLLPSLYEKAKAIFGPVVRVTYGKSEIVNPITVLPPRDTDAYYAEPHGEGICVGFAGTGVEIDIRDETGATVPRGQTGEVFLRGRHMYCGHIDVTGFHALPDDGFHDTGDLGRIDARGRLYLVGRMADVIKSGGYKIHPDEIERVLAGTAGTAAVAIVTLPSEYWGEIIVAVAETDDATWPDRARAAVNELARYKHPRAYLMLPELARNPQGKIMRRVIRAELLAHYQVNDGPHPTLERR
ncbi:MAG TPA: class I adenylate-forming enzyme family protein [Acetobacteraceae bacterium]|jgi:acyl-CoA synthetase (AMP-forming)/AMP-acid ligase II|nr:class I adenylate-forming enzyme family protein [Acetobacteraceae bacterium]